MPESFPMNGGDGTYSYTKNSQFQKEASSMVKEMTNEVIAEKLDVKFLTSTSNKFCIADLGCSVGPNTFFAMQNVIEEVEKKYLSQSQSQSQSQCLMPHNNLEFHVFFNDHASNDFNTLFASLPPDRQYFVAGVPGSFYDQLFPSSSLHFLHSSYALHWLSKVPEECLDKMSPAWNKGRISYASSSDEVANAFAAQFAKDMEMFLNARAKEIVVGGMMVLIMPACPEGIHPSQISPCVFDNCLESILLDMVNAGLINEAQVDSFNLPMYFSTPKEMTEVVGKNGYFSIERMEFSNPWSKIDMDSNSMIMHFRASMEGIFTNHFGTKFIHELFERTFEKSAEISSRMESSYKKGIQLLLVLKRK